MSVAAIVAETDPATGDTPPRRMAGGAEIVDGGVAFRLWAADHASVRVVVDGTEHAMTPEKDGWHVATVTGASAGARYGFLLGDDEKLYPDPVSRLQPEGPHAASAVVDPDAFAWTDGGWEGVALPRQVIMELHVGTFTPEGTWAAAAEKLDHLVDLGVTVVEMMPVNDFPGRFGWGYDGVGLYAPTALYGTPDDLRRFVDRAHSLGIAVILDVVYNHIGPDGNYLTAFSKAYFAERANAWGTGLNFDGDAAAAVRRFFIDNAAYWIREFHFDGLRLDATQEIHDASEIHVLREIGEAARAASSGRRVLLVAESEPQARQLVDPVEAGGCGLDAIWNDDFHHSARIALTGRRAAFMSDYEGSAAEIAASLAHGFLYQNQRSRFHNGRRGGSVLRTPPMHLVTYLENHDQVSNSVEGSRLVDTSHPGLLRAMTAALLLGPQTPMLFQGQEWGAKTPFVFFADHGGELGDAVRKGRHGYLAQFPWIADRTIHDPTAEASFRRCALDWDDLGRNGKALALHRDLIALRRTDPTLRRQGVDGMMSGNRGEVAVVRFLGLEPEGDRLLLINLGPDVALDTVTLPIFGPPTEAGWKVAWSSEEEAYGGVGWIEAETEEGWRIAGRAATLLAPREG